MHRLTSKTMEVECRTHREMIGYVLKLGNPFFIRMNVLTKIGSKKMRITLNSNLNSSGMRQIYE